MATLRQKIEGLAPERKARVSQRAEELIAEEASRRASDETADSEPEQDNESADRKLA